MRYRDNKCQQSRPQLFFGNRSYPTLVPQQRYTNIFYRPEGKKSGSKRAKDNDYIIKALTWWHQTITRERVIRGSPPNQVAYKMVKKKNFLPIWGAQMDESVNHLTYNKKPVRRAGRGSSPKENRFFFLSSPYIYSALSLRASRLSPYRQHLT